MRKLIIALSLLLSTAPVSGSEVESSPYTAPDGSRVIRHISDVPAPIAMIWEALTTTEGVQSWAVPVADVDFRLGGIWESSYKLDARIGDPGNIHNRFLSYLPLRMVAIQTVEAPPEFPHAELLSELFTVIELAPLAADWTRVTVSMLGFGAGEGFDALYRHFDSGNAWTLSQLRKRFIDGPADWQKLLAR